MPPRQGPDPSQTGAASPEQRALQARLDEVEESNRRLRRQGIILLVATSVLLGLAAALVVTAARHGMPGFVPDLVEGREFVLRDKDGRVRGAWGSDDEGSIRFVLQDPANATSIKLNLLSDGSAGLTFSDSAGSPRLIAALLPDQTASLVFADRRGVTRTVMSFSPSGASSLLFADQGGNPRTAMGVDSRGRALFTVEGMRTGEEVSDTTR